MEESKTYKPKTSTQGEYTPSIPCSGSLKPHPNPFLGVSTFGNLEVDLLAQAQDLSFPFEEPKKGKKSLIKVKNPKFTFSTFRLCMLTTQHTLTSAVWT